MCFVHITPAPTNAFPGQCLERGWEEPGAPIPAPTPGRKLLSVTVFVLEKPRLQRGRQNVLTLKISPIYSTPQLHRAPESSLCSVFCCVRFPISELPELQIILSSTNGRSSKLFMRDTAFIYNTEGIPTVVFCLKTTKTLHLNAAVSS